MRGSGWHKEKVRHSLAARGLPTGRYMKRKKYFVSAASGRLDKDGFLDFTGLGPDAKQATPEESAQDVIRQVGAKGTTQPASITKRLIGAQGLEEESVDFIRSRRPVERALDSAGKGSVGQALTLLANGRDENGKKITSDEAEALQSALNVHAVSLASSGAPVPDGIKEMLDSAVRKRVELIEEQQARELESPFKTVLREAEKDLAIKAVDAPINAAKTAGEQAFDSEVQGLKVIGEAGFGKYSTDFPGIVEQADRLEKEPFIAQNALIGNEERGAFKTVDSVPRLSSGFDFAAQASSSTDNVALKSIDRTKSFNEDVQSKVDSLNQSRKEFAKIDLSAYKEGDNAFKEGDREGLISAIAELQSQEAVLKDKWNFVSQTHAQAMSVQNHESAFKEKDSALGVIFSTGGARQLADQAEKINNVRGELVKSNNKVAGRRRILENRLQRLDSEVPPETSLPRKKVTVFGGTSKQFILGADNVVLENDGR